jgi:hypothetical protein
MGILDKRRTVVARLKLAVTVDGIDPARLARRHTG